MFERGKINWQALLGVILMLVIAIAGSIYNTSYRSGSVDARIKALEEGQYRLAQEIKDLRTTQGAVLTMLSAISAKQDVMTAEQRLLHSAQAFMLDLAKPLPNK